MFSKPVQQPSPKPSQPEAVPQVNFKKLDPSSQKVAGEVNEILRRLRVLEERYSNLRKKNQLSDQNMLEDTKRLNSEIKVIQSTVMELKKELADANSKIRMLTEEMGQSASKNEIKLLSKYLDLWEPIQFIRREEAKKLIEDIIEDIRNQPKVI